MSTATSDLRKNICIKTYLDVASGKQEAARSGVGLCLERARLVTESYKETEGEPMVVRRAKALAKALENMTIYIGDREQIVGNFASDPRAVAWYPEIATWWLEKALNDGYRNLLDEKGKEELGEIHKYWHKNSLQNRFMAALPDELKEYVRFNGVSLWAGHARGKVTPNYTRLFRIGLQGLIKEAEEKLEEIENDSRIHAKDYVEQKDFLTAVIITLKAAINWAKRYAEKARETLQAEEDIERKKELEEIVEICDWVPANPPRTFHEALQFFWFVHLSSAVIDFYQRGCGLRADLVFYPFYKKALEEGRITREQAQELMEFLFIKFEEVGFLEDPSAARLQAGGSLFQNLVIGGVDERGDDVTNEISYIVLDAAKAMRTLQPSLVLRYHDQTPFKLVDKAIDVIRTGVGYPALFNDKVIVPLLLSKGFSLEDSRNYTIFGCVQWEIPGKNSREMRANLGHLALPKCLELALNQGIDKFNGRQLGYPTPDARTFNSIEDIMEAYLKQVNFFTEKMVRIDNICQAVCEKWFPRPYGSALLDDHIRMGKDVTQWRYHSYSDIIALGPTNVADSLAAVKKLVFEERAITMEELLEAIDTNFEGREDMRQMLLSAPKYGNDDLYVDSIDREVQERTGKEIAKFTDYWGCPLFTDGSGTSGNFSLAVGTGATPDGRKDREPFADAVLSPVSGRDLKGPTAVLKSASRIDPFSQGSLLLNQKFLPQFLEGDNKRLFASYLKTWADLGIYHIQFNVADQAMLLDAQEHPEKYTNLIVRIAGYSAYFVDLPKGLQDDIIKRTDQSF